MTTDVSRFDPTSPPRLALAVSYLASLVALMAVTIFALVSAIRPALEGKVAASPEVQAMLAELYPFAEVGEARMIWTALNLVPVLLALLTRSRIAAWVTIVLTALLTLVNVQDAVGTFILGGRALFGIAFALSVAVPALIAIGFGWRWARAAG